MFDRLFANKAWYRRLRGGVWSYVIPPAKTQLDEGWLNETPTSLERRGYTVDGVENYGVLLLKTNRLNEPDLRRYIDLFCQLRERGHFVFVRNGPTELIGSVAELSIGKVDTYHIGLFAKILGRIDDLEVASLVANPNRGLIEVEMRRYDFKPFAPPLICLSCKYFHGSDKIVCAVHPSGNGNDCLDHEKRSL